MVSCFKIVESKSTNKLSQNKMSTVKAQVNLQSLSAYLSDLWEAKIGKIFYLQLQCLKWVVISDTVVYCLKYLR